MANTRTYGRLVAQMTDACFEKLDIIFLVVSFSSLTKEKRASLVFGERELSAFRRKLLLSKITHSLQMSR